MSTTHDLAVYQETAPALRVPALPDLPDVDSWIRAMASIAKLADKICDTEFVPAAMRGKPDAVAAAILTGRELGLPPMLALRTINMIKGTPSLSAEYMRSKVQSLGHEFRIAEWDEQHCVIYGRRKGEPGGREFSYTIGEARKAGLIRKNKDGSPGKYETDPMAMMLARATTRACKAMFGDVINGLATTELLDDADATGASLELPAAPRADVTDLRQRAAAHTVRSEVVPSPSPAAAGTPPAAAPPQADAHREQAAGEAPITEETWTAVKERLAGLGVEEGRLVRVASRIAGKAMKDATEADGRKVADTLEAIGDGVALSALLDEIAEAANAREAADSE